MKPKELELQVGPITRLQLIKYAGASGDFNPIHIIDEKAKETGLPGVIAHGMLTMGFMAQLFSEAIEKGGYLSDFSTRFTAKVFVGDTLTVRGELVDSDKQESIYNYRLHVYNQKKDVVASGKANLILKNITEKENVVYE